jgi:glycosyltransferase involved in cell wall biosynthesis
MLDYPATVPYHRPIMRALYIYTHGYPSQDGHSTASRLAWRHLHLLARRMEIDLLCLVPLREAHSAPPPALQSLCRQIIPIPSPPSRAQGVRAVLRGLLAGTPPALALKRHPAATDFIRQALQDKTLTLLAVHSTDGLVNIPPAALRASACPLWILSEEIQWTAWRGYRPWQWRAIGLQQAFQSLLWRRMKQFERARFRLAADVACLSEREQEAVRILDPAIPTTLLPLPLLSEFPHPAPEPGPAPLLLFTGHFGHPPNRLAAVELARQILPLIQKEVPSARLRLAGHGAGSLRRAVGPRPELIDSPLSLIPLYREAAILLGPIRTGEGVRGKFLESLACGCPVITTPLGASGIRVREEEGLLRAETPHSLAGAAIRLLRFPALRRRLGSAAAETVRRTHSLEAFDRAFNAGLDRLLANRKGGPA